MAQKIFGLGIGGAGIVAVLIIAGILLKAFNANAEASNTAIWSGVGIGATLGILGIFGVMITLAKRI
jgi:hypothetical protein